MESFSTTLLMCLWQSHRKSFSLRHHLRALTLNDLHPFYSHTVIVAAVTVAPGPFSVMLTSGCSETHLRMGTGANVPPATDHCV